MDLSQLTQYASEAISAAFGFLAGCALTFTFTKSNKASFGSTVTDNSGAKAGRDNNFGTTVYGDNVKGDKVQGDKVSAETITINK
jgi:hypothetical protein